MKAEKKGKEKRETFDNATFNIEQEMYSLRGIGGLFMGAANTNDTIFGLDGLSILIEGIADRIQENLETLQEIHNKPSGASPVN